jgi:signal transduction histidine kinase
VKGCRGEEEVATTQRRQASRPAPADRGSSEEGAWGRWRLAWHAFFYLLLAYATAVSISDESPSAAGIAARLALAGAMGGWYAWWLIGRPRAHRGQVIYLSGAVALWIPLIVLHPAFLWLGLGVLAPLCLHDLRHGAAVVLVVAAGLLWQLAHQPGGVPWPAVAAVSVFVAGTLLGVGYVGAIVRQSQERQRLLEQLQATRVELAAAERQAGMLQERQRLARDIHDTLSQGFASVVLLLEAAQESLATGQQVDQHITQALRSARDNLAESRGVVWALRPSPLAEQSVPQALEELGRRFTEETGVCVQTAVTGTQRPLGTQTETALLRIAQEALANVRKHAAASQVTVTLSYLDDVVVLDVADDGVGFDPAATQTGGGLGLHAMRERVTQFAGSLTIESAPAQGTTVAAELPTTSGRQPG